MNLADLFSASTLTDSINKLPFQPTKIAASGLFGERGITTEYVTIEARDGRLYLVDNKSRDADPTPSKKDKRTARTFRTLHLPDSRGLLPSDLQPIRAFGSEQVVTAPVQVINDNLQQMKNSLSATREWGMMGALSGKILDADGSVVYDLYDEFGVTAKSITIPFTTATTEVRKYALDACRWAEQKLGGVMVRGYRAYCGKDFFDALTGHKTVKEAFASYQAAADRLGGDMRQGFTFGGITFEEYNATVSGQPYVAADKARVYPVADGVFQIYNSPANYNEAVGTVGQAFYAKGQERRMGKGWDLEAQANPLAMCLYPEALVELVAA